MTALYDVGAEAAVLGGVLLDSDLFDVAAGILRADDFYLRSHQELWDVFAHLRAGGAPIDTTIVRAELVNRSTLSVVGDEYLLGLTNTIPVTEHVEAHAKIVRDKARLRACRTAALDVIRGIDDQIDDVGAFVDSAEARLLSVIGSRGERAGRYLSDVGPARASAVIEATSAGGWKRGLSTGLRDLDELIMGLEPGQLVIAAGRPSMGKSAFASGVALKAAEAGLVAVFTLEMSADEWADRMLCAVAGVNGMRFRAGRLRGDECEALPDAVAQLRRLPIFLDDALTTLASVGARARRLRAKHGALALVVVDYLQLLRGQGPRETREAFVADVSRSLKAMARELSCPVLALSQLNRASEARHDKRPSLADLRESGAIEQDADVVLLLYRAERYDDRPEHRGLAEIIVAKQRNGPTGIVKCMFSGERSTFRDYDFRHSGGGWHHGADA